MFKIVCFVLAHASLFHLLVCPLTSSVPTNTYERDFLIIHPYLGFEAEDWLYYVFERMS